MTFSGVQMKLKFHDLPSKKEPWQPKHLVFCSANHNRSNCVCSIRTGKKVEIFDQHFQWTQNAYNKEIKFNSTQYFSFQTLQKNNK